MRRPTWRCSGASPHTSSPRDEIAYLRLKEPNEEQNERLSTISLALVANLLLSVVVVLAVNAAASTPSE